MILRGLTLRTLFIYQTKKGGRFSNTNQIECILDQICFDFQIQRTFKSKWRTEIHFKKPGLHVGIEQYIIPEQLKAITSVDIWSAQIFFGRLLNTQQTLYDYIVNFGPHESRINPNIFKMLAKRTQRPFVARICLRSVLILHKIVIFLIDWVIGEVSKLALFRGQIDIWVLAGGKSDQTFSIDVKPERIVTGYHHVESEVKFVILNQ